MDSTECAVCFDPETGRVLSASLSEEASLNAMSDLAQHGRVWRGKAPVIVWQAWGSGAEITRVVSDHNEVSYKIVCRQLDDGTIRVPVSVNLSSINDNPKAQCSYCGVDVRDTRKLTHTFDRVGQVSLCPRCYRRAGNQVR